MQRLWIALTILLTVIWVACGGGSSNANNVTTPPSGPTTTLGSPGPAPAATTIVGSDYFALDLGPPNPWPTSKDVNFGIWRSLGGSLRWSQLEPTCDGGTDPTNACYSNWATLDTYMAAAAANGQQVLFTAYYTPQWASSNPSDTCQQSTAENITAGGCDPPNDVGTGDVHWTNFLTALYNHVTANGQHIDFWECWNEPNVPTEYNGQLSDLHTLCSDLRSTISKLDSSAKFTTPAPALGTLAAGVVPWMKGWVGAGFDDVADIVAFHGYTCGAQSPCTLAGAETVATIVSGLETTVKNTSAAGKPLWDTEGSDNTAGAPLSDPDEHAAFLARFSLIQQSLGVATFSYWGWNFGGVNLIDPSSGTLNPAGTAWQQLYNWTNGATYTNVCTNSNGSLWQCGLKLNGTQYLILWDASQSCSNGTCTASNVMVPSQYTQFDDLAGDRKSVV